MVAVFGVGLPILHWGWKHFRYGGVVIANGHNWDPHWPVMSGEFHGRQLHSAEYKTPDLLAGKRVLVVGAGNSGCDIAVESAQHAALSGELGTLEATEEPAREDTGSRDQTVFV